MRKGLLVSAIIAARSCWAQDNTPEGRANSVKEAFKHAWEGYLRCGSGKDTVDPIQCSGINDKGSWGVTNIDAIGTALIMELYDTVNQQIQAAVNIDFTKLGTGEEQEGLLSSFDSTVSYLGGLLSVHDLLLNGYGEQIASYETKAQQLLIQAKMLGDTLTPAWNTLSGFPGQYLNLTTDPVAIYNGPDISDYNSAAGIGTLQLEYARLSNLTGLTTYVDRSIIAARKLFTPTAENGVSGSFAGMVGRKFDINTGEMASDVGGWIAGVSGYYEYLLKMYVYDPTKYQDFLAQFKLVAGSTLKHLVSNPAGFPNTSYVAATVGRLPTYNAHHFSCSSGGILLQASSFLADANIAKLGLDLIDGCRFIAKQTSKGIPPEQWAWLDLVDPVPSLEPSDYQNEFVKTHGFWTPQEGDGMYYLRSEYFESLFYAYRITKDEKYRDWAWDAFSALNASCYHTNGYVPIYDVTSDDARDDRELVDAGISLMESFFLAKTLKYAYLIFKDPSIVSLDDWVFNTQGHPIRIQARDVERKMNVACFQYDWCTNYGWH